MNTIPSPESRIALPEWEISTRKQIETIPANVFIHTSHSGYEMPDYDEIAKGHFGGEGAGRLSEFFAVSADPQMRHARLLDVSDFAVGTVSLAIHRQNPRRAAFPTNIGRAWVNVNGPRDISKHPMSDTFGHVPIFDEMPSDEVREIVLQRHWDPYHQEVTEGIVATVNEVDNPGATVFAVDIHDTDDVVYDADGKLVEETIKDTQGNDVVFPQDRVVVSDRNGQAAKPELTHIVGRALGGAFIDAGFIQPDSRVNKGAGYQRNYPYGGGDTTNRYGIVLPNEMVQQGNHAGHNLHHVQIELPRTWWLNSDRTAVDAERAGEVVVALARGLANAADRLNDLGDNPFKQWR